MSAVETIGVTESRGDAVDRTEGNNEKISEEKASATVVPGGKIHYVESLEDMAYGSSVDDLSVCASVGDVTDNSSLCSGNSNNFIKTKNAGESLEDLAYCTSVEDFTGYSSDGSHGCVTTVGSTDGSAYLEDLPGDSSEADMTKVTPLPSSSCETLEESSSLEVEPSAPSTNLQADPTPDILKQDDEPDHLQHDASSVIVSSKLESHIDSGKLDVTTPAVMIQEETLGHFQRKTLRKSVEGGTESSVVQRKARAISNGKPPSSQDSGGAEEGRTNAPATQDDPSSKDGEKVRMKKELGLFGGISFIVGCIIGSGIFVSPKGVLVYSGSVGMSLAVWVSSGLMTLVGAICYAELGTMFPQSGGVYTYLHESCGSVPAFIYLWMAIFILQPANKVVDSLTFANYFLQPFFPDCEAPPDGAVRLFAASAICILAWLNCKGVKRVAKMMEVLSVAKVLAIVSIIAVGIYHLATGKTQNYNNVLEGTNWGATFIASAFYQSLFTFDGWDYLNMVTEELKDPCKTLPRAIIISISGVTIIYTLANIAYFAVLTPSEILSSSAIAVTYGNRVFGVMAWIIPLFVACSTLGSVNGAIFTHSRIVFVGARRGHLPKFLTVVNVEQYTPVPAILFMTCITLIMFVTSEIRGLINYISFANSLTTLAVTTGLLWMRYKRPDIHRPIKVWLVFPVLFWCCCVFLVVFPVVQQPLEIAVALGIIVTGLIVYYFTIHRQHSQKVVNILEKMNYTCQVLTRGVYEEKED